MKVNLFIIRVLLQVELGTNTWEEMEYIIRGKGPLNVIGTDKLPWSLA